MNKPTLVIMAAGMGSRFGGCKQITPVDDKGHAIIDFSVFDAVRAGFGHVVCVIKPEIEKDFKEAVGDRLSQMVDLKYAYQTLDALPEGFAVPEGRVKPWGTAHAVLCALPLVEGPFAVINADDFYGRTAFETAAAFLTDPKYGTDDHAMVGYRVENTLTENGTVSRGVCSGDAGGRLTDIVERTKIAVRGGEPAFTEDDGATWQAIPRGTLVSMNLWAFHAGIRGAFADHFRAFLENDVPKNPLKGECYLPYVPRALIREGKANVYLLRTEEKWYGMTYREDIGQVQAAIADMKVKGIYPV